MTENKIDPNFALFYSNNFYFILHFEVKETQIMIQGKVCVCVCVYVYIYVRINRSSKCVGTWALPEDI